MDSAPEAAGLEAGMAPEADLATVELEAALEVDPAPEEVEATVVGPAPEALALLADSISCRFE